MTPRFTLFASALGALAMSVGCTGNVPRVSGHNLVVDGGASARIE